MRVPVGLERWAASASQGAMRRRQLRAHVLVVGQDGVGAGAEEVVVPDAEDAEG